MEGSDGQPESGQMIERGETYPHAKYGRVEVTGIWRGRGHQCRTPYVYVAGIGTARRSCGCRSRLLYAIKNRHGGGAFVMNSASR